MATNGPIGLVHMDSQLDMATQSPHDTLPLFDAYEDSFEPETTWSSDGEAEKDEIEKELENIIFGDDAGFKAKLKAHPNQQLLESYSDKRGSAEYDDRAFATIDDADLFFLDAGPDTQASNSFDATGTTGKSVNHGRPPAWEDSEDERTMVSLLSIPRLRKLRQYEGENIVSGREYTRRLRQQFELLNPRPRWADWSSRSKSKKRRRGHPGSESSAGDTSSGDDMDISDSEPSAQPIAQLLRSNESLTRGSQKLPSKRRKFQTDIISVERMKDIQPQQPSAITCLAIHPTMPLLLSAGPSSTLFLHHLLPYPLPPDPPNPLITSLHLKHTPLSTAAFSPPLSSTSPSSRPSAVSGPKIYLSSRRRYFHVWDLPTGAISKANQVYGSSTEQRNMSTLKPSPCGRYVAIKGTAGKAGGIVNILDAETLQWAAEIRADGHPGISDFCWWRDGSGMSIVGRGGEVSEWSERERKIVARWQDEGGVGTSVMAMGGEMEYSPLLGLDRWVAIGSRAGIVNIYDRRAWVNAAGSSVPAAPKPTKMLDNLTTAIGHLVFSPCGQILAMASRWKRDALRLVHLPSCTVYRNFPTAKTPLGRISAVALGEYWFGEGEDAIRSLLLVVGNEAGSLRAWELGS